MLIETELWPSWIAACARHGIPVVVASGRLSDRSFPRYRRLAPLLGPTLRRIAAVGARTELDAERFVRLGVPEARVRVTGDLKLDPAGEKPALGPGARAGAVRRDRSSSAGAPIAAKRKRCCGRSPRRRSAGAPSSWSSRRVMSRAGPSSRGSAARTVAGSILRSRLENRPLEPGEVLILDTYGELAATYAAGSLAFVGGTLVPVGGHNVSEPVHAGCPVLYGPHFANVRKIVEILEADGAGRCVATPDALVEAVVAGLFELEDGRRRGEAGRLTLERHRGSVERTHQLILETLARRTAERTYGGTDGARA